MFEWKSLWSWSEKGLRPISAEGSAEDEERKPGRFRLREYISWLGLLGMVTATKPRKSQSVSLLRVVCLSTKETV